MQVVVVKIDKSNLLRMELFHLFIHIFLSSCTIAHSLLMNILLDDHCCPKIAQNKILNRGAVK
jgi:hypothetical protein